MVCSLWGMNWRWKSSWRSKHNSGTWLTVSVSGYAGNLTGTITEWICRKCWTLQRFPILLRAWDEPNVCPAGGVPWTSRCSVPLSFQPFRIDSCQCWCWWGCQTVDCNTHTKVSSDYIQCGPVGWCSIVMYVQEVLGSSLGPQAKQPTWGSLWCISVLQADLCLCLPIGSLFHLITHGNHVTAVHQCTKSCHWNMPESDIKKWGMCLGLRGR
jgi:hypothetical protein